MLFNSRTEDLFMPLPQRELNDLFNPHEEGAEPITCGVCLNPESGDFRFLCSQGHSFCLGCCTNIAFHQERRRQICPLCRGEVATLPGGGFMLDRVTNSQREDFFLQNPNYDPNATVNVELDCPHKDKGCAGRGNRAYMKEHLEKGCAERVVKCAHSKYGCCVEGPRSEVAEHMQTEDHTKFLIGYIEYHDEEKRRREDAVKDEVGRLKDQLGQLATLVRTQQSSIERLATQNMQFRDDLASVTSSVRGVETTLTGFHDTLNDAMSRLPVRRTGDSDRTRRAHRQIERQRAELVHQQGQVAALRIEVNELEEQAAGAAAAAVNRGRRRRRNEAAAAADAAASDSESDPEIEEVPAAQRARVE